VANAVSMRRLSRLVLCLALAAPFAACSDAPAPATRPNFVWIVADDMSFEVAAFGDLPDNGRGGRAS